MRSIYKIDRLVPTEIKMMEVSERSVLIRRVKLKYAMLTARNFDDYISAWCQRFDQASSTPGVANRGGMEFDEANMAMVRDIDNDR
jgi:hypothetical protein